jgi:hypothetical protein
MSVRAASRLDVPVPWASVATTDLALAGGVRVGPLRTA